MKLFISYRSLDSAKVDPIVHRLRGLKNPDGTATFESVWQDKDSIPAGQDWWQAIVQGITECHVMLFMVSQASVQSAPCRAELSYASRRNRFIIPVVLEGEFGYNRATAKFDIAYWNDIPAELNTVRAQFLWYEGGSFIPQLEQALSVYSARPLRDTPVAPPLDPRHASEQVTDALSIYDEACEYAGKLEFAMADTLFRKLMAANDPDLSDDAHQWVVLLEQYRRITEFAARPTTLHRAKAKWLEYRQQFPKPFIELFDPKGFAAQFENTPPNPSPQPPLDPVGATRRVAPTTELPSPVDVARVPTPRIDPIADALERARNFKGTRNTDWTPFITTFPELAIPDMEWCLVPCGTFMMGDDNGDSDEKPAHKQTFDKPYWIARYPVTNAQWTQAVKAGVVSEPPEKDFWGNEGPLKWYKDMAMADAPVTGGDWFASGKFAAWLNPSPPQSSVGAQRAAPLQIGTSVGVALVRLPTEREWEYAARGVSNLVYPWGNDWEGGKRAVWKENSGGKPNPVTSKPEGASWIGALHLSGNVWEWCSSLYQPYPYKGDDGREDSANRTDYRLLRGASWWSLGTSYFRTASRSWDTPDGGNDVGGVRPARS
jgi:formylglycine-generating enzyme required for sulfatase activity